MKSSGRIDGPIRGAIFSSRPSQIPGSRAAVLFEANHGTGTKLCVGAPNTSGRSLKSLRPGLQFRHLVPSTTRSSSYSTVTSHCTWAPKVSGYFTSQTPSNRNWKHTSSDAQALFPIKALPAPSRSKEELLAFVDQYDDITVEEQLEFLRDPYMRRYAPAETPPLTVSDKIQDVAYPGRDDVERASMEEQQLIAKLRAAVFLRLTRPHAVSLDKIYDLYCALPGQRVTFLQGRYRHSLLSALGATSRKDPLSMFRYFAVVADIKNSGYPLTRGEWNTAMSFASRYVGTSTEVEAEAALHLWREMEHEAGTKGDAATFNILFDIASKAGKFELAEMIYQEMGARGFPFDRYHHVSLIHFFGLKMNSSGVRAAYKEMVEAGEMIDTTTFNCVIASLVRCGDDEAAERVYERMKASNMRSKIMPAHNYMMQRRVTQVLKMFARFGRKHPEFRSGFQSTAVQSPDLSTYRILINHFGVRVGDLHKVARYLDEMKWFRVPLHGSIFLGLFKGFSRHGSSVGSDWHRQRLDSVWGAFLEAFDAGADGFYISKWMGCWILRAFTKCTQDQDRILEVYEQLSRRWDLDDENTAYMLDFLHKLLRKNGLSIDTRSRSPTVPRAAS